jgi:hypothetical protein
MRTYIFLEQKTRKMLNLLKNAKIFVNIRHEGSHIINSQAACLFHSSNVLDSNKHMSKPSKFLENNKKIFEPQSADEKPRPAVSFCIT